MISAAAVRISGRMFFIAMNHGKHRERNRVVGFRQNQNAS